MVSQHKTFSTIYFQKKIFASKLAVYNIYQVDTVVSILYGRRALTKFPWVIVCQKTKD